MDVLSLQWNQWLALVGLFTLGAVAPGASLAVIVRHSIVYGRRAGVTAAVGHGLGIGIYSGLTVFGVAIVMLNWPGAVVAIQVAGALFLLFLAWQAGRSALRPAAQSAQGISVPQESPHAWRDGFLIAFLNPKVGIFFVAVFTQFLEPGHTVLTKILVALLAAAIDTVWYILVALLLSTAVARARFLALRPWIDGAFALLLLIVASGVLWEGVRYLGLRMSG